MSRLGKLYLTSTVGVLGYHGVKRWNQLETKPKNSREINDFLVELTSDKFFDSMFWPIAVGRYVKREYLEEKTPEIVIIDDYHKRDHERD